MKNKLNNWILVFCLSIFLSFSAYGQRDTIKYYAFRVGLLIKDTNAYPVGISSEMFVITHRSELDSIFKKHNVYTFYHPQSSDTCNNRINIRYQIICNCNEYLLLDTLIKFNAYNDNDFICKAFLNARDVNEIMDKQENYNFIIYPNPVNNILTITAPSNIPFKIKIFNTFGMLIYYSDKITNTYTLNLSNLKSGIYFLQINSESQNIIKKFIKN